MMNIRIPLLLLLFLTGRSPIMAEEVRIYRDAWGVPHIYAGAPTSAMFGLGYAQAEDRIDAILQNYRIAVGQMAEEFGPDYLESDLRQRLWGHETWAQTRYPEIDPEIRAIIEAFTSGIAAYMRDHPERVPPGVLAPKPHHVVALGRYMAFQTLEQQADAEYNNRISPFNTGNQWIISAQRSAEDAVILCADPFALWDSTFRAYEAHLHAGDLHAFGFAIPGLPVFFIGHNQTLGWSALPGGADGADVYEIALDSPIADRYRYDDTFRSIQTDSVRIAVRINGRIEYQTHRFQHTPHGPILQRSGKKAYAYRFALSNEVRQIEQQYRIMTAKDQKAFYAALALNQNAPQRILYGDVYGNIAYFITGRIPVRSEFFSWHHPISGNTSETEWQGIHDLETLPQILNPNAGWLQDSDASIDRIANGVLPTGPQMPMYTYRYLPHNESIRSVRTRTLLDHAPRLTLPEAIQMSQDTYLIHSEHWLRALNIAMASSEDSLSIAALNILNAWTGRADRETTGATLYVHWRTRCAQKGRAISTAQILTNQPLGNTTAKALREALTEARRDFMRTYGRLNVYWKELYRLQHRDQSWPLAGISTPNATSLRAMHFRPDHHVQYGTAGPSSTMIICFRAPGKVESYSVVPFGQSDNPQSNHRRDQAERLFSQDRLKPTQFGTSPSKLQLQHRLQIQ